MNNSKVTIGLYQHFKGDYYFVQNILKDCSKDKHMVQYFNLMRPEVGTWVRDVDEWFDDVSERVDNVTGQKTRFAKVRSLTNGAMNLSTDKLLDELASREDSPLHGLDIEELSNTIFSTDYCIGEASLATADYPQGVYPLAVFSTKEEAEDCMNRRQFSKRARVFKRTFIEV